MLRALLAGVALAALAAASLGSPEAPRVELRDARRVQPGRPLAVRVPGGADRVRAPGTPWALPLDPRGEEFVLQMPAAVVSPLHVTVERAGEASRVSLSVAVEPAPPIDPRDAIFDPLSMPPDPDLFSALAEVSAAAPRVASEDALVLAVLAAAELVLVGVLAFRTDRGWRRAAWLSGLPLAALGYLLTTPVAAPFRATTLYLTGDRDAVFVRLDAVRDGEASLTAPGAARSSAAVVRYAPDDRTVESVEAGLAIRTSLRAGESRAFGWACARDKTIILPQASASPGPALSAWVDGRGLRIADAAFAGTRRAQPASGDTRVLPVLIVQVEPLPAK